jgi:hypothetical protein
MRPARGTECVDCRKRGHRCEAVIFAAAVDGNGEVPVCMACADGDPCVVERVGRAGRESSATVTRLDVWGNDVGGDGVPAVVTRTPEELGIPREVPAVSCQPSAISQKPAYSLARSREPVARVIRDEPVRLPALASMGAEMLDEIEPEKPATKEETMTVKSGRRQGTRISEETKQMIREAPDGMSYAELAREFGVTDVTVRLLRIGAGKAAPTVRAKRPVKPKANKAAIQRIEVDTRAPGTAAALLGALDRRDGPKDGDRIALAFELTPAELQAVIAGLSPAQLGAMAQAGLRAALLTKG